MRSSLAKSCLCALGKNNGGFRVKFLVDSNFPVSGGHGVAQLLLATINLTLTEGRRAGWAGEGPAASARHARPSSPRPGPGLCVRPDRLIGLGSGALYALCSRRQALKLRKKVILLYSYLIILFKIIIFCISTFLV